MAASLSFLLAIVFSLLSQAQARCPEGTVASAVDANTCYKFVPNATSWIEAKLQCNNFNGHLTTISDGFTNLFLNGEAQELFGSTVDGFFIGANDISAEGSWVWEDGSGTLKYHNWARGEPSRHEGFDCGSVSLHDGLWHAISCFDKHPFVCTVPQISSACPPPPTCPDCPTPAASTCPAQRHVFYCDDGWTIHNDHCYRVTASFNVGFWEARVLCQEWNADLASIHNQAENDFVKDLTRHGPTQCGGPPIYPNVWIGLTYDYHNAIWKWTDGSMNNYSYWSAGEPNYDAGRNAANCVELYADADTCHNLTPGLWNDLTCASEVKEHFGICKKSANYF